MEIIQENEQWKFGGDCAKCRRNSYCSKPCTCYNKRARRKTKRFVAYAMNKMSGGLMREIINKTEKDIL